MMRWIKLSALPLFVSLPIAAAASRPAAAQGLGVSGVFEAVDLRAASDVAASLQARQNDPARSRFGATMRFDDAIHWTRERCEAMDDPAAGAPARVDPNLADLQIVATGSADPRLNRSLALVCRDAAGSETWSLLIVDDRTIAARGPSAITYVVLEKRLSANEGLALERALQNAGLDPGEVDGIVDSRTRSAVADFIRRRLSGRSSAGILTRNVLDAIMSGRFATRL